jgi:DNA-binding NtrC family response regulator
VVTAASVDEAERALDDHAFHVVFLDLLMPERRGEELLPRLQTLDPQPLVAVISASLTAVHQLALSGWRGLVLPKPISPEVISQVIEQAEAAARCPDEELRGEAAIDARLLADFSALLTFMWVNSIATWLPAEAAAPCSRA